MNGKVNAYNCKYIRRAHFSQVQDLIIPWEQCGESFANLLSIAQYFYKRLPLLFMTHKVVCKSSWLIL